MNAAAIRDWLGRIGKSFIQGAVTGLSVGQLVDAISRHDISAIQVIALGALGGGVAAVFTALRVLLMKPPSIPGIWGVMERAAWTFIAGAVAAVPVEAVASGITNADVHAVGSAILVGLGGGVAALISFSWNMTTQQPLGYLSPALFEPVDLTASGGLPSVNPRIPKAQPPG